MNKELRAGLAWAGAMLALVLVATYAHKLGYVDSDTAKRVVGINGLMIAWYGNRAPKSFVPSACVRRATRVGGWSLVLSGLTYAGLWAFAPIQVAITGGCAAVMAGIAVTLFYCLSLRAKAKAA